MPTYEYKCDACGQTFEKFQSITAEPIRKCPHCGKNKVRRLIGTGAGLIFKGSGFYLTDYRDASYKEKAKAESGAASSPADAKPATADAKSDTKPAESAPTPTAPASDPAASAPPPAGKNESKPHKPTKAAKKPRT